MEILTEKIERLQDEVIDISFKINHIKTDARKNKVKVNFAGIEKLQLGIKKRNIAIARMQKELADKNRAERLEKHNSTDRQKRESLFVACLKALIKKQLGDDKGSELIKSAHEISLNAEMPN